MHFFASVPVILMLLALSACDKNTGSAEDQVRNFIQNGVKAAEARNASELIDRLHPNYLDHRNNDKSQISRLIRALFFRHRNIHLFTRIKSIQFPTQQQARVTLFAALTGSIVSEASLLSGLRAQIYRFELELTHQDGEWLLHEAKWQRASRQDLSDSS